MNKMTGKVTFSALATLSKGMTNGDEELRAGFRPDLVYLHNNSMGGRKTQLVEGAKEAHAIYDGAFGSWLGYAEHDSLSFKWTSGSSGASIEAVRQPDGSWQLEFTGCDDPEHESSYVVEFAAAVDPVTVDAKIERGQALANAMRHNEWLEANNPELASRLRLLADMLGLPQATNTEG